MKYKAAIIINLLFTFSTFANKPEEIQYISPIDGSELNSRTTQIIIRQGDDIDPSSISSDIFTVTGEKSGLQTGNIILSTDGKTIIFKPTGMFDAGEQVHVLVNDGIKLQNGDLVPGFKFSFKVTPLIRPLKVADYSEELNLTRFSEELQTRSAQTQTASLDDLPTDFPTFSVEVNDNTSEGDYFFSPTRIINGVGYNVIVSNTGELKYYEKIEDGVPFDFKVASNGMLSYGTMAEYYSFGGGGDTKFKMMDYTFSVVDSFQMGNGYTSDFHEFQYLPNGHVFMVAYDLQPVDLSELVDGGHPGALVAGSVIQELDADGNVIFQWRSWDYYDLLDSYADLTQSVFDGIHINSIELDYTDLNIIISTLALAEATKIDRNTGEIIWRMSGKNNEFTFVDESEDNAPLYFMFQHDIRRLKNGNITIFDGGDSDIRKYSRAVEYEIDEENKTATKVWEYRKDPDIYSPNMGSVQRLENGNTVIGWGLASMYGDPMFTEVDADGNVVAELTFDKQLTTSYRVLKCDWDSGAASAYVVEYEVVSGNSYEFNEDAETGISMKITNHDGFGYNEIHVWQYDFGPLYPEFMIKAPVLEKTDIVIDNYAIDEESFEANLMFDVDFFEIINPDSAIIYHRENEGNGLFSALPTQYNKATNKIVATMTEFGEFVIGYPENINEAFAPLLISPKDGQLVDQSKPVTLEWTPVGYTNSYYLEVATDESFTNKVVESESLTSANYTIESVDANTEYFWRVKSENTAEQSDWTQTSFNSSAPFITLLSPEEGTKWTIGLDFYITWEDNLTEEVSLDLYQDGEFLENIDTTTNSGGYKWSIPLHLDTASNYSVYISSADDSDINDESALFSLVDYDVSISQVENTASFMNITNPSYETAQITYNIKQQGHVLLNIYNTQGTIVSTLVDENQTANTYTIDYASNELPGGIYICTLKLNNSSIISEKMLIVK